MPTPAAPAPTTADQAGSGDAPAWHALPAERAAAALGVDLERGLDAGEARSRLEEHGPNVLQRQRTDGPLTILVRQVADPLIVVLIAAAVLAFVTGSGTSGFVVLGVVVVNALIGFVQEYRAGQAIEAIMGMVPATATVLRDGQKSSVPAAEIVPGDVLELAGGDRVPADARLAEARTLRIEESSLTGESVPAEKGTEPLDEETALGDRAGIAFGGTLVTSGTGTAVVVATAGETELGRISAMLDTATDVQTPLTRQLAQVGRTLTIAIVVLAAVLFGVGLLRGSPVGSAALAAISLAVGAVPEGLPAVVTISLAIGVRRMARRRALIRRLPAVETLGSTTVICSDKTGTLTRNEMTVTVLVTPSGQYGVGGVGYDPEGDLTRDGAPVDAGDDVRALVRAGALCNDAALSRDDEGWRVAGDPTEGALLAVAAKLGIDPTAAAAARPRRDEIPFDSERQYMATLNDTPGGDREILVKGAPEVVLRRCTAAAGGGDTFDAAAVQERVEALAERGLRVLALASATVPASTSRISEEDVEGGLGFLGLEGMIDPPRPEAVAAVAACQDAGIAVKMITGDHPGTARAIGAELGLGRGDGTTRPVVTGTEIGRMSDEELDEATGRCDVFARVAPEHKLRLVSSLQGRGHVVAMTGDGVNDAPALKQADIGVAMGITGTDVSKEAADVVLTDDDFASIESAVEEGRRISDTLVKALAFILPTNIGLAVILTVAVAGFPIVDGEPLLPVLPTQILWINLVAAVCLALPLAFEALEPDTMRRPPRDPREPLLNRFVLVRTALVAVLMAAGALALFLIEYQAGADAGALATAQTMAVVTVVLFQVFYLLNCRSLRGSIREIGLGSNRWVYVGIAAVLALQVLLVYAPFMNTLFGTAPLSGVQWLQALAVAVLVLPIISVEKWIRRRPTARS